VAQGSVSPFEIVLSAAERQELEHRARCYTASYAQVLRAKIVLFAVDGLTNVEIAARLDTSPQVVHRWRKRFCEHRLKGLQDAPRSGRPRVFSPLGERRDQSLGVRVTRHQRRAPVAVELLGAGPGDDRAGRGGVHLRRHDLADTAI
jgi:transposase-like protein